MFSSLWWKYMYEILLYQLRNTLVLLRNGHPGHHVRSFEVSTTEREDLKTHFCNM